MRVAGLCRVSGLSIYHRAGFHGANSHGFTHRRANYHRINYQPTVLLLLPEEAGYGRYNTCAHVRAP